MTCDDRLRDLAEAAGIAARWRDARGEEREVAADTLRAVLAALGLPARSADEAAASRAALAARGARLPPLITARQGPQGVAIPGHAPGTRFRLRLEDGEVQEGRLGRGRAGQARLPPPRRPGYHRLELPDAGTTVAVAPPRCFGLAEAGAERHRDGAPWGIAVQLYSLRRRGDLGIGDLGAIGPFARDAARRGAACVAISPVHAQFAADPRRFGPYAPSSRLFLNVLHADPEAALGPLDPWPDEGREALDLVDWPGAARTRLARLRRLFDRHGDHPGFVSFREAMGDALEDHARFEALHGHFFGRDPARWNWRDWPEAYRDPRSPAVLEFARGNAREVAFHAFCQWLADESLRAAQAACRDAGMPIGLIADLAVGTDPGGSHAWSRQREILPDVSVGAPPDMFSPMGQDWGLTAFSPRELAEGGFVAFTELLRATMRHGGGIRVDHAMGLARLWVVPRGARPSEGAYLRYPLDDLLRLLALESHRHRVVVIGEDLGTVPPGFRRQIERHGALGMRVLWFERDARGRFAPPERWQRAAAAMTTTHDLPTVAGWWAGRDIEWRERLGLFGDDGGRAAAERAAREKDRRALWAAMRASGAAAGEPPPPEAGAAVADAAMAHVGGTACVLGLLPIEDALALAEQPNLPGTVDQHPNWRRRLPREAGTVLHEPDAARRVETFARARRRAAR
ncbi:4-alpha-glucanotransferase [Caldovatus sediminis]|uniref:4-alpha-glucanotransferase n=1 Tax=Caldovatus sediminis TaxID=2041189 RepID=A0A8J2ZC41_9PROT|nr:4-alpha-glucanotransferase [Caldovatus sediminis]GGG35817.1 4-alpha-glucanotransferase [Caldovatus sediminis]